MTNGWDASADAWIRDLGEDGDFGRRYVMDAPMMERACAEPVASALDVGCGEGRFCRMLKSRGIGTIGLDPTGRLLETARQRDPEGTYVLSGAEAMPIPSASIDLTISYLSLIDIEHLEPAIAEMVRVTRPGGRLLIANLNSFNTAGADRGWVKSITGERKYFAMDHYMKERGVWCEWRGIRIINHHRPLSTYMKLFLGQGLQLLRFDEPLPAADAPADKRDSYVRAPWFCLMEWRKPAIA